MSAYIVEKAVIDVIVTAAILHELGEAGDPSALGQMLLDENVASVSSRYPNDADNERPGCYDVWDCEPGDRVGQWQTPYSYRPVVPLPPTERDPNAQGWDSGSVGGALEEYEYQSCEHPGWGDSAAHSLCSMLRMRAMRAAP